MLSNMLLLIGTSNWTKIIRQKMIMRRSCLHKNIGTLKFKIIWIKIREGIETQATTSKNPIVRSTENYSYRQDAIYARHDSQARIHQH
jgi:hypothetical protein